MSNERISSPVTLPVACIHISEEGDVAEAVETARVMAETAGFNKPGQSMVATATSELAQNIYRYAPKGRVAIKVLEHGEQKGIEIVAEDDGPGIGNLSEALKDHFSTTDGSLGLGLPGAKRLMDESSVDTDRCVGTRITVRKWIP